MPHLETLLHRPIFAFSGIARNEEFLAALREMGFDLRGWKAFADHHTYSLDDLIAIETLAARRGAALMVTTEKDRVKIDTAWIQRMPLLVVGVQIDLGAYTGDFRRFVIGKLETIPRAKVN
jgi:tetraacyldisaccharide-1-P 4'-kinase